MGQYVITIAGTGIHHNYKTEPGTNKLIPDGKGGWARTINGDADALATEFVALLKKHGHHIEHASITVGGASDLLPARSDPTPG